METPQVILSSPLIIGEGRYDVKKITVAEAKELLADGNWKNFCGHQTVRVLGVEPAEKREICKGYRTAISISPNGRLERREYTLEEIEEIGYTIYRIDRS